MEYRFTGRNVDLLLLTQWIERFLNKKGFKTVKKERQEGYKIAAKPTYVHEIIDAINISVLGDSTNFLVRFTVGARSGFFMKFGLLTTLFGGGFAFLKGAKSQEEEDKLERKFWVFLQEKIDFLDGSAE
jgi:hypothetical protein